MPQMTVHCTISNCGYWKNGNLCDANEILIASDAWAAQAPDRVDAMQASTLNAAQAQSCLETCCKTFVQKGHPAHYADNVQRQ